MVIASRQGPAAAGSLDPVDAAFAQLFGTMAANPAVQIIAVDQTGGFADLWARLTDDDEAYEMALYDALATYHTATNATVPVDLHLILADEPDDAFPSQITVLYRRTP